MESTRFLLTFTWQGIAGIRTRSCVESSSAPSPFLTSLKYFKTIHLKEKMPEPMQQIRFSKTITFDRQGCVFEYDASAQCFYPQTLAQL